MSQNFDLMQAYVNTLTGHPDTIMDWRCIHDTNKAVPAHNFRGTARDIFPTLQQYNQRGYGIFVCINAMDGNGRDLTNVHHIRTHIADLDNLLTAQDGYNRAIATYPQPHFAVQSSPGKFHIYWLVEPYTGNDFYNVQQRKLAQLYDGDKSVIDPTRVLRVPGFFHLKGEPYLVQCWMIHNGPRWNVNVLADSLAHINAIAHISTRSPLGDPEMQAPTFEWLKFALYLLNPNDLERGEWVSISAAFKQAGWNLANEETLLATWQEWCAHYSQNNVGENLKLWHSFRDTEVGWAAFERRTTVGAYIGFGAIPPSMQGAVAQLGGLERVASNNEVGGSIPSRPTAPPQQEFRELLSAGECALWFKDCYAIERTGEIFSPSGRYMNSTQFNMKYGGKHFIISSQGKTTDEAWKAALRSTVWTIPKVDHVRFLPQEKPFAIIEDKMGRKGLNTYIPVHYDARPGDVSLWLKHCEKILPNEQDRNIWYSYLAHCVKFPGYKIPWAVLLQSGEGVGKTVFFEVMKHALGDMYVYTPKAQELVSSGSKFNAWMRGKLCIVVNEIKVDERRELIEILKPMITEASVEVQAKGVDQEMEDNPANWIFFSNFKDAIPINQNGRRYAVFYSAIQTARDLQFAGMDDAYFNTLWGWLKDHGGYQAITHWLLQYPIERGGLPVRAPETTSKDEALRISRSPMEIAIAEAIQDNAQGFRGGYVSSLAVLKRLADSSGGKQPSAQSIRTVLEHLGYAELGRAVEAYPFESVTQRAVIYANRSDLTLEGYGMAQGYIIA